MSTDYQMFNSETYRILRPKMTPVEALWFSSDLYRDLRWWVFEKWEGALIRRSNRYYRWRRGLKP